MEGTLKLANGSVYTGHWHGNINECSGELIFYTGMSNFLEFLTDPVVKDKIILATYPGVLNCQIDENKFESKDFQLAGLITQQEWINPANAESKLMTTFQKNNIPVLTGMDTRTIMKQLLKTGEMPACMSTNQLNYVNISDKKNKSEHLQKQIINPTGKKHLVVIDFGVKNSLIRWLVQFNYKLTIVPGETTAASIRKINPDGLVFSGGSGNPLHWKSYFNEYSEVAKAYPTLGFGLGHQILASAFGANIAKMKWGHRCFKHPVIHHATKLVYMTNQNHGYAIAKYGLKDSGFKPSFTAVQDGSIEGLIHENYPITTYQFHPDGKNTKLELLINDSFSHQLQQYKGENIYA
ncbi:carbamoyl phosphate synthase small subunit [Lederbergia citrea]|uniref:carbamoyl-phosphate synthase (glutamine-hydrolyzing) n=1 Tax=Lederbergia citrea TaxID=2833581 RepID=A0A942ULC3_9BACI|nr:carbamoyl phosphate synthase small subunit [Lederbergia citrea]MBS4221857.1 carbamoyl phosphate synthase small subunit [Lederbergia citrea]